MLWAIESKQPIIILSAHGSNADIKSSRLNLLCLYQASMPSSLVPPVADGHVKTRKAVVSLCMYST